MRRRADGSPENAPEGGAGRRAARAANASDSGCESEESVAMDTAKNKLRLSLDIEPGPTYPPGPGRSHSVGTGLEEPWEQRALHRFQPILRENLSASASSEESPRRLPLSLSTLHDKEAQTGNPLLRHKDGGFYTYVKDVAPQSSVIELAKGSTSQGGHSYKQTRLPPRCQ